MRMSIVRLALMGAITCGVGIAMAGAEPTLDDVIAHLAANGIQPKSIVRSDSENVDSAGFGTVEGLRAYTYEANFRGYVYSFMLSREKSLEAANRRVKLQNEFGWTTHANGTIVMSRLDGSSAEEVLKAFKSFGTESTERKAATVNGPGESVESPELPPQ